jgi:hypothetical protein
MRCAIFALILYGLPQDEARIRDWIRGLEDDSAEVRDRAFAALVGAGGVAEPELRKAAEAGGTEVRARAAEALRAIGWKRRYDPGPSLITIRREKAPLRAVLEELAKQSATPLKLDGLEEETAQSPLTVHLDKVPFFKAFEAVCGAHGKVDYVPRCGWGEDPMVYLGEEVFASCPRVVEGAVELRLKGIVAAVTISSQGQRDEKTEFEFNWSWEKGTHPLSGRVEIEELRDETGTSYLERLEPTEEFLRADFVQTDLKREMPCVPPEGVTRFKVIKGALVVVLPLTVQEFVFDAPATLIGASRESKWGTVKLADFEAGTTVTHVKVEARPEEFVNRVKVALLDTQGREFEGFGAGLGHMGDHGYWKMEFPRVEGRSPAAVRCTAEVGRRERRISFEFRDVRFR